MGGKGRGEGGSCTERLLVRPFPVTVDDRAGARAPQEVEMDSFLGAIVGFELAKHRQV